MKKRISSLILVGTIIFSICSCGNKNIIEDNNAEIEPIQEDIFGTEMIPEEEIEEKSEELPEEEPKESEVQQTETVELEEAIYTIQSKPLYGESYEMQDWQKAYAEYIDGLEWGNHNTYSLIYVDDDDIPELVVDTGIEAGGCQLLTFYDGEIDKLQTARLLFYYIEKQNRIDDSGGHMGYYYDYIYSIENGKWVYVTGGEWTEIMGDDDWVYKYEWADEEVNETVYEERLNAVFNSEQAMEPDQYYILEEMLSFLHTGDCMSQKHRYELFIEDVTWDEAKKRCEERGGYLATVTAIEEFERIREGIEDSSHTDIAFWVGANYDSIHSYCWLEPNQDLEGYGMLSHYNALWEFWASDEPSYSMEVDGEKVSEDGVYLLYDDVDGRCFLYDAPKDILAVYPEYKGKIGYICEYDE